MIGAMPNGRCKVGRIKTSESTDLKQRPAWQFQPGVSGNPAGRPKSSKNRLTESFLVKISAAFEAHGESCIERVVSENPAAFLTLIRQIMPKDLIIRAEMNVNQSALDLSSVQRERIAQEWLVDRESKNA